MAGSSGQTCQARSCTVSADGRCLEGFARVADCPNLLTGGAPSRAPEPVPGDQGAWVELPEGGDLDPRSAERLARAAITRVVLLAGAADSGKTTLLATLYEAFQHGPFARHVFAGCETLLGFERRCYLGRIDCGRATADTARSSVSSGQRWLHLRVRAEGPDPHARNVLFSEISGDFLRLAKDSTDECRRLTVSRRADHFAILIDGAKLVQPHHRFPAANDAALLLRSCLDADMLGRSSFVDVLFTKWDVVARSADVPEIEQFIAAFTERTRQHCEPRLGRLRFFRLAARPSAHSSLAFAHGLSELFASWMEDSPAFRAPSTTPIRVPEHASEFDRYLWRQLPALRPGG